MHPKPGHGGLFSPLDHHHYPLGGISRGVSRNGSDKSSNRQQHHLYPQQTAMPLGFASLTKPLNEPEVQVPQMGAFDATQSGATGPGMAAGGGYVSGEFVNIWFGEYN